VGEVVDLGRRPLSRESIIAFAREFDPQPFHLDEEAARATIYGGLLASGWHTASLMMRMLYDGLIRDTVSLGSPGVDELRWLKPVRPGDTLSARLTVLECTPSRSKPDRGILRSLLELRNQHGEVVVTMRGLSLLGRKPGSADATRGSGGPPSRDRAAGA
jgi:acyl dehydratase